MVVLILAELMRSGGGAVVGERLVKNYIYRFGVFSLVMVYDGERVSGFVKRLLKREVLRYEDFYSILVEFI